MNSAQYVFLGWAYYMIDKSLLNECLVSLISLLDLLVTSEIWFPKNKIVTDKLLK